MIFLKLLTIFFSFKRQCSPIALIQIRNTLHMPSKDILFCLGETWKEEEAASDVRKLSSELHYTMKKIDII